MLHLPFSRRRLLRRGAGAALTGAAAIGLPRQATASGIEPPTPPEPPDSRQIFCYYYYWYDITTGAHLREEQGLRHHLPTDPRPTWRDVAWHRRQLVDMAEAGIDTALPVYWGFDRREDDWSTKGLGPLSEAWRELADAGQPTPRLGMFFDTTFLNRRDLTTSKGKHYFYANISDFFNRIPREAWALVNGKPVIWLFTTDSVGAVTQATFDFVYENFAAEFGARPYIVREVSWDYPILEWRDGERRRDYARPIRTENSYIWAASIFGYVDRGGVATVGPGYDETRIPGRSRPPTDRQDGLFYYHAFLGAIASGKPLLAIETWNEIHEGSGISETVEFGRQYIDYTRALTPYFRAAKP